jgi:hypothetical protein
MGTYPCSISYLRYAFLPSATTSFAGHTQEQMDEREKLTVRWISLRRATAYIKEHHRHLPRLVGGILAIGVWTETDKRLCGVLVMGRPVARLLDNGETMEVVRCAHDGTPNAGSALYGRARRLAQNLGCKLVTYTMQDESGASLRGAGFICDGEAGGGNWNCSSRKRADSPYQQRKLRWKAE